MKKKEKKYIAPNEASLGRWIAVVLAGLLIGNVLAIPLAFPLVLYSEARPDSLIVTYSELNTLLTFVPLFIGQIIALKVVGKTSLKDFVLGVGRTLNKKECLTVLGLYLIGFAIHLLSFAGNIRLHGVSSSEFVRLLLLALLVTWTQTTWEELIFRGLVIRWACKNEVGFTKKAVIAMVVSSAAFAVAHMANPEVTSQSGIRMVMAVSAYVVPGIAWFLANLHFGNMMPGIIMHWANNFLLFTLISGDVSAISLPTLLVDTTPHSAEGMFAGTILTYLPVIVYLILDARKKKKAASMNG